MDNTIILNSGEKIEVLFQDEVSLDIDCALRYIKSGEAELENYVKQTAEPRLESVIDAADKSFEAKIAQGIKDASSAATAAGNTAVTESKSEIKGEVSTWTQTNIIPVLSAKASEAQASAQSAQASAQTASTHAASAQTAAANASASVTTIQNLIGDVNVVRKSGNETIAGVKTFSSSPVVPTPAASDNSTKAASTAYVTSAISKISQVKTGTIMAYGSATVPVGYLKCDGSTISRTTYAALFKVIGTTYGAGDGNTTFKLPALTNGVISTSSTVRVYGSGKTLGLTNGTDTVGLNANTNLSYSDYMLSKAAFNQNPTTTAVSNPDANKTTGIYGVVTTWSQSGLTGSFAASTIFNWYIKY